MGGGKREREREYGGERELCGGAVHQRERHRKEEGKEKDKKKDLINNLLSFALQLKIKSDFALVANS